MEHARELLKEGIMRDLELKARLTVEVEDINKQFWSMEKVTPGVYFDLLKERRAISQELNEVNERLSTLFEETFVIMERDRKKTKHP